MYYSKIDPMSIVDGEGCRVTLFVSGCRNHCPGCFNEATWDFNYGQEFTQIEVNEVIQACQHEYIAGLTILGGEPFEPENQEAIHDLLLQWITRCPGKNLWMYTGYVLERDLLPGQRKHVPGITDDILNCVDTLVDGPFILAQRDLTLQFRGSTNQRVMDIHQIARLRGIRK